MRGSLQVRPLAMVLRAMTRNQQIRKSLELLTRRPASALSTSMTLS